MANSTDISIAGKAMNVRGLFGLFGLGGYHEHFRFRTGSGFGRRQGHAPIVVVDVDLAAPTAISLIVCGLSLFD